VPKLTEVTKNLPLSSPSHHNQKDTQHISLKAVSYWQLLFKSPLPVATCSFYFLMNYKKYIKMKITICNEL